MKQQPIDKETAKYNAISEIAGLLRETTYKYYEYNSIDNSGPPKRVYKNSIFNEMEHETVKRTFLRLVESL